MLSLQFLANPVGLDYCNWEIMRLRGLRLSIADAGVKTRRLRVSCSARAASRATPRVKVAFQLPYRTRFGQGLRLVGSGVLGEWDLRRAVPMTWSAGDIWKADLCADLLPGDTLQYKYVVCNPDGKIEAWKPGNDVTLRVPQEIEGTDKAELHVIDTWDGAIHEVAVETEKARDGTLCTAVGSVDSLDNLMKTALENSYEDLEVKLNAAQTLLEATNDPGAMELVLADRELAVAANKASALERVVEASTQAARLERNMHQP